MCPRYNNYPAGLGKGFDSGVVGAWLDAELTQVLPASLATGLKGLVDQLLSFDMGLFAIHTKISVYHTWFYHVVPKRTMAAFGVAMMCAQDLRFQEVAEVLIWTSHACSRYWRTIYASGLWLNRNTARQIVSDGWAFTVSCPNRKMALCFSSSFSPC